MVSTVVQLHDHGAVGRGQVVAALVILLLVLGLILTEVVHRTIAAFIGAAAVLFMLSLEHRMPHLYTIVEWMDHGTLALLWGMMIIVALLSRTGVFEWCAVRVFEKAGSLKNAYYALMILDMLASAFLDNVTTILLFAPVVVLLCQSISVSPKPMLISLAVFGNIGGTATMIGDPPNILIGNALSDKIGFVDFLIVLSPAIIIMIVPSLLLGQWLIGNEYFSKAVIGDIQELKANHPIREPRMLVKSGAVIAACVIMFFLHPVTHMEPSYTAVFGSVLLLLVVDHHDFEWALLKVEWDSLLFFAALFVFSEGLAELGLLDAIAGYMSEIMVAVPVESRQVSAIVIIQVFSALASAVVDNIPFTTCMLPVIKHMGESVEGLEIEPLAWALAFGACLGGMATLIGSSANIVMAGIAKQNGHHISFMDFFRFGMPMMCLTVSISTIYMVVLQYAGLL